jgi:hypothetical protein
MDIFDKIECKFGVFGVFLFTILFIISALIILLVWGAFTLQVSAPIGLAMPIIGAAWMAYSATRGD